MKYTFKTQPAIKAFRSDEDEDPKKKFGPLTTNMCPESDEDEDPKKKF